MPDRLSLYHHLPYPLKVIAASAHGYRLRRWRYGRETERLIEEALERESWSEELWKTWQQEKLALTLFHAAKKVPYYRDYWNKQQRVGNKASFEYIENWPVLEKGVLRQTPAAFISENCEQKKLYVDHTGGTTGTPLSIYESRATIQNWFALFEARIRRWYGVSIKDRWGIFGGQLITSSNRQKPPYWVYNAGLNQVYFSTFHISPGTAKDYVNAMHTFLPTHLIVYPSSLSYLAVLMLDQNLAPPNSIKVIFSNAEVLFPQQREVIQNAFKCPVVNTYGMGEITAAGSECQASKLHVWPEVGYFEVYDPDNRIFIKDGEEAFGEYILTGLLNEDMPLIRYQLGDRGSLPVFEDCRCKRKLPVIKKIEGRTTDMILTPDGRKLFWFNSVFYGKPVVEAQIVQLDLYKLIISIVPGKGYSSDTEKEIKHAMQSRVGNQMEIQTKIINKIPRTKSGKFKAVVSKLNE